MSCEQVQLGTLTVFPSGRHEDGTAIIVDTRVTYRGGALGIDPRRAQKCTSYITPIMITRLGMYIPVPFRDRELYTLGMSL